MTTPHDDLRARLLAEAIEYHRHQASGTPDQYGNRPVKPNIALESWHTNVADMLSARPAAGEADAGAMLARLDELLALSEQAVPGRWGVAIGKNVLVGPTGKAAAVCNYDNGPIERANSSLIAKAVNFIREHGETLRAALPPQADARPVASEAYKPIERDESMDREYIPMPGGWEIQTKGAGSTFRIAGPDADDRLAIEPRPYLHATLTRMARAVNAAWRATTPQPAPAGLGGALRELVDELDNMQASSHLGSLHAAGVVAGCRSAADRIRTLIGAQP